MLRRSLVPGLMAAALVAGSLAAHAATKPVYMPPVPEQNDGDRPTSYVPTWEPNFLSTDGATTPTNVDITNRSAAQSETATAIDPTDPNHILTFSNDLGSTAGVFESFDGGATWTRSTFSSSGFCYDPWIAFNNAGDVFLGYECSNQSVAYKNHGSSTWVAYNGMTQAGSFPDRDMITADNGTGSFAGSVYIGYDDNGASNTAYVLYSRTGKGNTSWTRSPKLNTTGGPVIGVNVAVAPNGTVNATWLDYTNSRVLTATSTNGGVSWSTNHVVHTMKHNTSGFWWYIPPQDTRGIVPFPMTAYAQAGPWAGRLYCVYTDEKSASTQSAIFEQHSDDNGTTWSAPIQLGASVPITYSYHGQVAVLSDGTVGVNFYGCGGATSQAHVMAMCFSHDGGSTWTNPQRVADTPSNEHGSGTDRGNQAGDYQGVGSSPAGVFSVVWTDTRFKTTLNEEMFWASMAPVASPSRETAFAKDVRPVVTASQPSQPYVVSVGHANGTTLSFTLPTAADLHLQIVDVSGRVVRELMNGRGSEGQYNVAFDGRSRDGQKLASGIYFYRLVADGHTSTGKIVL